MSNFHEEATKTKTRNTKNLQKITEAMERSGQWEMDVIENKITEKLRKHFNTALLNMHNKLDKTVRSIEDSLESYINQKVQHAVDAVF